MAMKTLVTGGAGFIGSHVVEALLLQGKEVIAIDNLDPFYSPEIKKKNLENALLNSRFTFIEMDIRNQPDYAKLASEPIDTIIHLAAKAGVRPSIANPMDYQEVNVNGTQRLLEFAKAKNIKKFIFASSSSVYGVNPSVPWKESDQNLLPISPYASTKVSCELLGHVYHKLYGIRFIALRFFTVYGPRQRPDLAIHKFTKMIIEGKPIPVFGDGTTRRDYTFVEDIVKGVLAAIKYDKSDFEIINLGNYQTVKLSELITHIEKAVGKKAIIDRQPMQPGDVPQTYASIEKASNLLGYQPTTTIEVGIARFVEWYKSKHS